MKKHEIEWIEKVCQGDPRYEEWKEATELQRKEDGCKEEAAYIWAEAVILVSIMHKAGNDRHLVFERWGFGFAPSMEKAMKQAAFYILCHPESEWDEVSEREWRDICLQMQRESEKTLEKRINNRHKMEPWWKDFLISPSSLWLNCCGMVANGYDMNVFKIRALKMALKGIMNAVMPLGFEALVYLLPLVTYLNTIYHGKLQHEMDDIMKKKNECYEQDRQRREAAMLATCPFTPEQLAITKLEQAGIWTTAMNQMLAEEERMEKGREFTDEDYCAAFLAVLLCNDEYRNRGEKQYFFKMMTELFGIDCSNSSTVERYVQANTCDYTKWSSNSSKQTRRKQLAVELVDRRNKLMAAFRENYDNHGD